MKNTSFSFWCIGALLLLSFLLLPGPASGFVHSTTPGHAATLRDSIPETQISKEEKRFRKHRKAAIILAINGSISAGLGALLWSAGMNSAYALTQVLAGVFGGGMLIIGGIMLALALGFGIAALVARKRMKSALNRKL